MIGLHEHDEDLGAAVVQHEIDEVDPRKAGLVAGRHHVAERQFLGPAAVVEGIADAAALAGHADEAAVARFRDQRRARVVHGRAEGGAERRQQVGETLRVRAADRHVVARGDLADAVLQRVARLAGLLGEAGTDDHRAADTVRAAFLQRVRHVRRRNDHDRQIHFLRDVGDGLVGLEAVDLVMAAADRIDRAREGVTPQHVHDAAADDVRVRGSADHRNGVRPEKRVQVWHGAFYCVMKGFIAGRGRAR
jgi:hypothetical protein